MDHINFSKKSYPIEPMAILIYLELYINRWNNSFFRASDDESQSGRASPE